MPGMRKAISVELLDYMGSDLMVANAARVSFHKESDWDYICHALEDLRPPFAHHAAGDPPEMLRVLNEKDQKLIRFLAREKHTTPFRHPQLHLRCKAPIAIARQLGKHQIGMSWNEVSRRYVDEKPQFYFPDCWRKRPEDGIKQGSGECIDESTYRVDGSEHPSRAYKRTVWFAEDTYQKLLKDGVAPEMARMVLPQSMLTEWIWTGSLYAFFNVWKQRADGHAQQEARFFAELLDKAIPDELRFSWETLKEYRP